MTNLKTTKRALLSSVVALLVCFTMLLGTTFAWFTDSVTSNGNIIQTGTLEIGMYWAEGDEAVPADANGWKDASQGAIFNNTKWEPGYVEAKHIKIANEGTLALKYKLLIVPNGEVEALADVIDVYYVEGATQVTRDTLPETAVLVGTLRDMIEDTDGAVHGALLPVGETVNDDTYEEVGEVTATIAFKMREEAGNEYKGMSIGTDFSIQLLATQYTYEEDGFDNQYDKDAEYPTIVYSSNELTKAISEGGNIVLAEDITLTGYIPVDVDKPANIDLNGQNLAISDEAAIFIPDGGELNIVNSSDKDVNMTVGQENEFSAIMMGGDSTLNIDNVTLDLTNGGIVSYNGGTINLNSGTIKVSTFDGYAFALNEGSVLNMYGGEIIVDAENGTAFSSQGSTINLYKGKITVKQGLALLWAMDFGYTHYLNIYADFSIELNDGIKLYEAQNEANVIVVDNRNN